MTWVYVGLFLAGFVVGFYISLLYCRSQIRRIPDREIAEKILRGEI